MSSINDTDKYPFLLFSARYLPFRPYRPKLKHVSATRAPNQAISFYVFATLFIKLQILPTSPVPKFNSIFKR